MKKEKIELLKCSNCKNAFYGKVIGMSICPFCRKFNTLIKKSAKKKNLTKLKYIIMRRDKRLQKTRLNRKKTN